MVVLGAEGGWWWGLGIWGCPMPLLGLSHSSFKSYRTRTKTLLTLPSCRDTRRHWGAVSSLLASLEGRV